MSLARVAAWAALRPQARAVSALLLASLAVAALAGVLAAGLNDLYLQERRPNGDTASYFYLSILASVHAQEEGRLAAVARELATNSRDPIRLIPYLLLAPHLLATPSGHLWFVGFALACFLATLGLIVWRRTGSLPYALAGLGIVFLADRFFNPVLGLAGNYPDLAAAYFLGAALLCLLDSQAASRPGRLAAFGVFAALATLSRFVAAGYLLFLAGPIWVYYLWLNWRMERSWRRGLLRPILWAGLPLLVLAGAYLYKWTGPVLKFYSLHGYALNYPLVEVARDNLLKARYHLGSGGWLALAAVHLAAWLVHWPRRTRLAELAPTLWAAAGQLVLLVLVLRLYDDWLPFFYALPGLYLLALAPFPADPARPPSPARRWAPALGLAGLVLVSLSQGYYREMVDALKVHGAEKAEVAFQVNLVQGLAETARQYHLPRLTFDTFFYEYGPPVLVANQWRLADPPRLVWAHIFQAHDSQWRAQHSGLTEDQIAAEAFRQAQERVDCLVILDDPHNPKVGVWLRSRISVRVMDLALGWLKDEPSAWRAVARLDSPLGAATLYRNLRRLDGSSPD